MLPKKLNKSGEQFSLVTCESSQSTVVDSGIDCKSLQEITKICLIKSNDTKYTHYIVRDDLWKFWQQQEYILYNSLTFQQHTFFFSLIMSNQSNRECHHVLLLPFINQHTFTWLYMNIILLLWMLFSVNLKLQDYPLWIQNNKINHYSFCLSV